jgi:hypothetical protein
MNHLQQDSFSLKAPFSFYFMFLQSHLFKKLIREHAYDQGHGSNFDLKRLISNRSASCFGNIVLFSLKEVIRIECFELNFNDFQGK